MLSYDDREDILNCTLSSVNLLETSTSSPVAYSALSYTWGEGPHSTPIWIDGSILRIPASLHNFLVHLFHYCQEKENMPISFLWADAICIDQSNTAEKSAQIPLMKDIFTLASSVLARLTSIPSEQVSMYFGQGIAKLFSLYPVTEGSAKEWERIATMETGGLPAAKGPEHISSRSSLATFLARSCSSVAF